MIKFLKRMKYIITFILLVVFIIYIYILKVNLRKKQYEITNNTDSIEINDDVHVDEDSSLEKIRVDIKGAIIEPGVYEVDKGNRVIDLINMAGGLTDNADTSLINLSKVLSDEMVIYVYTKEEVKNSNLINTVIKVVEKECVCPNIENDGCINDKIDVTISNKKDNNDDGSLNSLININTASLDELMNIPGIGKQKAEAIIKYRKDNKFESIEDITNVSGIGDSLYESIKKYITV